MLHNCAHCGSQVAFAKVCAKCGRDHSEAWIEFAAHKEESKFNEMLYIGLPTLIGVIVYGIYSIMTM